MSRWIFWDLGDTILCEDYLRYVLYERLYRYIRMADPHFTFADLMVLREQVIQKNRPESPILFIAEKMLDNFNKNKFIHELKYFYSVYGMQYIRLIPGISTVLTKLSKTFRLGIIANQPAVMMQFLKNRKLDQLFRAIYISELVGVKKPSPEIFQKALKEQRLSTEQVIYIGNRLEHDILPAMQMGIQTIFVGFDPTERGYLPSTSTEKMYFESIRKLSEWPQDIRNVQRYAPVVLTVNELSKLDWNGFFGPDSHSAPPAEREPEDDMMILLKRLLEGDKGND